MKTLLFSCTLQILSLYQSPALDRVVYEPNRYSPKVTVYLPKGFIVKRISAEGDTEYSYHYPDSSFFYISSLPTPHSYAEIRRANAFYDKQNALHSGKEFVVSGKNNAGLFWKDRSVKGLSIGFCNVRTSQLEGMENAMKSLVIKK